jgi:transposase
MAPSIWDEFQPDKQRGDVPLFFKPTEKLQYLLSYYYIHQPRLTDVEVSALCLPMAATIGESKRNHFATRFARTLIDINTVSVWVKSARDPGFPDFVPFPDEPFVPALIRYFRFRQKVDRYHVKLPDLKALWSAHKDVDRQGTGLDQYLRRFMKRNHLPLDTAKGLATKGTSKFFSRPERREALLRFFARRPKATLEMALAAYALPDGGLVDDEQRAARNAPSRSALYRVMKTLGLSHQHAHFLDPRATPYRDAEGKMVNVEIYDSVDMTRAQIRRRQITTQERLEFAAKQRDPENILHDPKKLLFMDETTFQLNMQQTRAWGSDAVTPILPKQKGPTSQTVQLMLMIGVTEPDDTGPPIVIFQTTVTKPAYLDNPLVQANDERFAAFYNELDPLRDPAARIGAVFLPGRQNAHRLAEHDLNRNSQSVLRQLLRKLALSDKHEPNDALLDVREMRAVLLRVAGQGRVGMNIARELREVTPGSEKVTSTQVANFLRSQVRQQWPLPQEALARRVLVWDNSVSHDAPRASSTHKRSWFHDHIGGLCGIQNVVFVPQYTPGKNPVEAAFAYIKRDVRKNCPETGAYTTVGMVRQIEASIRKLTSRMIRHWTRGCGYGRLFAPRPAPLPGDVCDPTRNIRRRHTVECAVEELDEDGNVQAVTAPVMTQHAYRRGKKAPLWRFQDKPAALRAFAESKKENPTARLRDVSAGGVLAQRSLQQHNDSLLKFNQLAEEEKKEGHFRRRWVGPIRPVPVANQLAANAPPALVGLSDEERKVWNRRWYEYRRDARAPPPVPDQAAVAAEQKRIAEADAAERRAQVAAAQPQGIEPGTHQVEDILDDKRVGKKHKFFVKWEGYDDSHNTWEPEENLNKDLVQWYFDHKRGRAQGAAAAAESNPARQSKRHSK